MGAAAVGLRALLHLRGDHLVLNFGEDLLAFLQAQAHGCQRNFYGSLPGADIHFDCSPGAISATNFSFQFNGLTFAMASV